MAPGPDPRFRPWLPSVMKYDLRVVSWNQPFPSQVSLWCLSQWLRRQDVLSPKFGDIQSLKDSNSCFYSDPGISSENSLWFCVCWESNEIIFVKRLQECSSKHKPKRAVVELWCYRRDSSQRASFPSTCVFWSILAEKSVFLARSQR